MFNTISVLVGYCGTFGWPSKIERVTDIIVGFQATGRGYKWNWGLEVEKIAHEYGKTYHRTVTLVGKSWVAWTCIYAYDGLALRLRNWKEKHKKVLCLINMSLREKE